MNQEKEDKRMNLIKEIKFNYVKQISKQEYIKEVNEAGEDIPVVLHLYKDSVDECVLVNSVFDELSQKFPKVKFLKGISDKIVPDFPDRQLPYILYYKNGKMQKGVQRLEFIMSIRKVTEFSIRNMLSTIGVKELEIQKKAPTVKDVYMNKMGWRKKIKEDFDSESEDEKEFIQTDIKFK